MAHKQWTLLLGRFQVPCPHQGHIELVKKLLAEGKNVIIGLRKEDGTEKNPYKIEYRKKKFEKIFGSEIADGRVKIIGLPDIVEVAHGRTPGWNIYEIKIDDEIEKISGTEIRKKYEESKNR